METETEISLHDLNLKLDGILLLVGELIEAKRELEKMAESLQGKGPLALMSMFK